MSACRRVATSPFHQRVQREYASDRQHDINDWRYHLDTNAYGLIVVWEEASQRDLPVICGHGGSRWLCQACAEALCP